MNIRNLGKRKPQPNQATLNIKWYIYGVHFILLQILAQDNSSCAFVPIFVCVLL